MVTKVSLYTEAKVDVTQEIEQRAQWSAPAWSACCALCSISCVTSTLASVYGDPKPFCDTCRSSWEIKISEGFTVNAQDCNRVQQPLGVIWRFSLASNVNEMSSHVLGAQLYSLSAFRMTCRIFDTADGAVAINWLARVMVSSIKVFNWAVTVADSVQRGWKTDHLLILSATYFDHSTQGEDTTVTETQMLWTPRACRLGDAVWESKIRADTIHD